MDHPSFEVETRLTEACARILQCDFVLSLQITFAEVKENFAILSVGFFQ